MPIRITRFTGDGDVILHLHVGDMERLYDIEEAVSHLGWHDFGLAPPLTTQY